MFDSDELNQLIKNCVQEALRKRLTDTYNNPLDPILRSVVTEHSASIQKMLSDGLASCVNDSGFREEINKGIRQSLAKLLVNRFGGELEKQVNALKSDPVIRARITVALDEIVKQGMK